MQEDKSLSELAEELGKNWDAFEDAVREMYA